MLNHISGFICGLWFIDRTVLDVHTDSLTYMIIWVQFYLGGRFSWREVVCEYYFLGFHMLVLASELSTTHPPQVIFIFVVIVYGEAISMETYLDWPFTPLYIYTPPNNATLAITKHQLTVCPFFCTVWTDCFLDF